MIPPTSKKMILVCIQLTESLILTARHEKRKLAPQTSVSNIISYSLLLVLHYFSVLCSKLK